MFNYKKMNTLDYHLSKLLKNNKECYTLIKNAINKHADIEHLVEWKDESYKSDDCGRIINYEVNDDNIKANVQLKNQYDGNMTILIGNHNRSIMVIDNFHDYNSRDKNIAKIKSISINNDNTYNFNYQEILNYGNSSAAKVILYSSYKFSLLDNAMLDYHTNIGN